MPPAVEGDACPVCLGPSGVEANWETLFSSDLVCGSCGVPLRVEYDEDWGGDYWMNLVRDEDRAEITKK